MIKKLMKEFNSYWPYHDSFNKDFFVEDSGSFYRLFIKNTCEWYKNGNGCTMCNYSSRDGQTATMSILKHEKEILDTLKNFNKNYKKIKLYINGSFFNENEFSFEIASVFIMNIIKTLNISIICVESRSEYVTFERLKNYIDKTKAKFEICFGLETVNDDIRNFCLNKGSSFNDFLRAKDEIKELCSIKVYLLVKPPFISERNAIDDTLNSIKILVDNGITNISFTPIAIQENTVLDFMLQESLYRPLWIWSIIEINTRLHEIYKHMIKEIKMSGLDYYPEPNASLFNCEKCSDYLIAMLKENPYLQWENIKSYNCNCILEWKNLINMQPENSIQGEIEKTLTSFNKNVKRAFQIASAIELEKSTQYLTDIAKLTPNEKLRLNEVGIKELVLPITVDGFFSTAAKMDIYISLDEFHRGIHMSRLIEKAYNFSENIHYDIFEDISKMVGSLITNNTIEASLNLDTQLIKEATTPLSNKKCYVQIPLKISSIRNANNSKIICTIQIPIINACPCTLITSQELFSYQFSHTQKGIIELEFRNCDITFKEIVNLYDKYISIFDLLKREDEIFVVNQIFQEPLFCEDICRQVTKSLYNQFNNRTGEILIQVITDESIHPHQACARKLLIL